MSVEERRERRREKRRKKHRERERERERLPARARARAEGMRSPRGVAEDHTESRAPLVARGGPSLGAFRRESLRAGSLSLSLSLSLARARSALLPLPLHSRDLPRYRYRKGRCRGRSARAPSRRAERRSREDAGNRERRDDLHSSPQRNSIRNRDSFSPASREELDTTRETGIAYPLYTYICFLRAFFLCPLPMNALVITLFPGTFVHREGERPAIIYFRHDVAMQRPYNQCCKPVHFWREIFTLRWRRA